MPKPVKTHDTPPEPLMRDVRELIRKDVLKEQRAEYGQKIFPTLSGKLVATVLRRFTVQEMTI